MPKAHHKTNKPVLSEDETSYPQESDKKKSVLDHPKFLQIEHKNLIVKKK